MRMSREDRREQIVEAALRVADREGFSQLTIRSVAHEANISLGVVHYCFQDKQELQREMSITLVNDIVRFFIDCMSKEPSGPGIEGFRQDLYDRTLAVFLEFLPRYHHSVLLFEVMASSIRHPSDRTTAHIAQHFFSSVDDMLEDAFTMNIDRYHLRTTADPGAVFPIITNTCVGMSLRLMAARAAGTAEAEAGEVELAPHEASISESLRTIVDLICLHFEEAPRDDSPQQRGKGQPNTGQPGKEPDTGMD